MPTVRTIISVWLKNYGFDGLYTDECGCLLSDLIPCDRDCGDCKPGYKHFNGDSEWYVYSTKRIKKPTK